METAKLCLTFGMRVIGIDERWEHEVALSEKYQPAARWYLLAPVACTLLGAQIPLLSCEVRQVNPKRSTYQPLVPQSFKHFL